MCKKIIQEKFNILTLDVFGLKVSTFEDNDLLHYIDAIIKTNNKIVCYGYSFGTIPYFREYPEICKYANTFDISVCDGRWFYLFCKIHGYLVKSDTSIPYMTEMVLELADQKEYSIMILGSTKANNELASKNIKKKYPQIEVLKGHDGGFFTDEDNKKSVRLINQRKPDILLIGVSSPKKEAFSYELKDKLSVKIIIPCGGYVDILSGKSKKMPIIIKKIGLAFLYRFFQEPRRLLKDSILNSIESFFILFPKTILIGKNFSLPKYYHKNKDFSIT